MTTIISGGVTAPKFKSLIYGLKPNKILLSSDDQLPECYQKCKGHSLNYYEYKWLRQAVVINSETPMLRQKADFKM